MSIAVADILTFVNNVLHRSPAETDINVQIQTVLDQLSQGPFIEATDSTQSLTSSSEYLTKPDQCFSLVSIVLNDGSNDLEPLKPMPGGYKALREELGEAQAVTVSNPLYYAEFGGYFWLWPQPAQSYTARIDYYKLHDTDGAENDDIEFGDEWKNAIQFGSAFEAACKFKLADYIEIWGARYRDEKDKQRLAHPGVPRIVGS